MSEPLLRFLSAPKIKATTLFAGFQRETKENDERKLMFVTQPNAIRYD